ncbi:DUF456 domain-containing protein [Nocardioides insulae]|uniref:DUF456 domain-containing protein n=1 Tax=Nocardioides insulae TaxID=394734 RepID=UPI00041BAF93|nr:DUF456 domain-containing protein [Nocardioides insulae]
MSTVLVTVLVSLAIAVGLAGIVVPILPGVLLIAVALFCWALFTGGTTAWVVFGLALAILLVGQVVKYLIPGKRLSSNDIPASTQWLGVLLGVVGFFVIPVVGLFIGFPIGVYLAEWHRVGHDRAWNSTVHALKALGLSIVIELISALIAVLVWVCGLVALALT